MTTVHLTAVGAAMGRKRVQDMNMIFAIKAIAARAAWAGARVAHICDAWVASMRGASFVRMCGGRGATALSARGRVWYNLNGELT